MCEGSEQSVEEASDEAEIEAISASRIAIAAGPAEAVPEEHKRHGDHADAEEQEQEDEARRMRCGRRVGRRRNLAEGDPDGG